MKNFLPICIAFTTLFLGCGEQTVGLLDADESNRIPIINLESPTAVQTAVDETFTIQASFNNVQILDTWNIYYISDATPNKSESIATDLPVTNRTIAWDTSEMPAGEYYFFAELIANNSTVNTTSVGSILITHDGEESNSSPTVTVTSPNGYESYDANSEITISWQSSDNDGDSLTADIEYSSDGGNSWNTIESAVDGNSYSWQTDSEISNGINYKIRVTVEDENGSTNSDTSNRAFTIF